MFSSWKAEVPAEDIAENRSPSHESWFALMISSLKMLNLSKDGKAWFVHVWIWKEANKSHAAFASSLPSDQPAQDCELFPKNMKFIEVITKL